MVELMHSVVLYCVCFCNVIWSAAMAAEVTAARSRNRETEDKIYRLRRELGATIEEQLPLQTAANVLKSAALKERARITLLTDRALRLRDALDELAQSSAPSSSSSSSAKVNDDEVEALPKRTQDNHHDDGDCAGVRRHWQVEAFRCAAPQGKRL